MKFLLIETTQIFVSGDERSITNPGHGYGEHTVSCPNLHWFNDEEKLKEWINRRGLHNLNKYKVYKIEGEVSLSTNTILTLKD